MNTPIYDFVKKYSEDGTIRLHMPGHKGQSFLGCENLDITEIRGADVLFDADGTLLDFKRSEREIYVCAYQGRAM